MFVEQSACATRSESAASRYSRRGSGVKLACAGALSVAAIVATGCGGSSSPTPGASGEGVAAMPAQASATTTQHVPATAGHPATAGKVAPLKANEHSAPLKITKGQAVQRPAAGTGGGAVNDENPAGKASRADSGGRPTTSGQPNPCVLVSATQAQTFTGRAVAMKEAPLGPTCIYQEAGAKASVTLAVQRLHFSTLKPHIKKLSQL